MRSLAEIYVEGLEIERAEAARLAAVRASQPRRKSVLDGAPGWRVPAAATAAGPKPANDNTPKAKPEDALPEVLPSEWHGQDVPRREWFVPDLIPSRTVTLLSGDGGLGKSLAALQLGAASALGGLTTMGLQPRAGRVMYVGAEDEAQEFHRRLAAIVRHHDKTLGDLAGDFLLVPLADRDATMMRFNARGEPVETGLTKQLVARITEFRPALLVLDTSADLFGGDEVKRSQVRAFVASLRQIATLVDCAVLLLSHPSVAGMQSGTGLSGSTAWNNSVRSRLYLTAPSGEGADPDARTLSQMKSNYGSRDGEIRLRWQEGVFVVDDGKVGITSRLLDGNDERTFIDVLRRLSQQGRSVGTTPGTNYAPTRIAEQAEAKGLSKERLRRAMERLLAAGEIKLVWEGPPSRQRQRLIVTADSVGD